MRILLKKKENELIEEKEILKNTLERVANEKEQIKIELQSLKEDNNKKEIKSEQEKAFLDEVLVQNKESKELIQNSITDINNSVTNIASVGEEITASSQELTATTEDISSKVNKAHEVAKDSGKTMNNFAEEINTITNDISAFSDKIMNISNIVQVIKEISSRTDLLSLNASIESARAGESGKGFAVVASEIRKLAEQTKVSSGNINNIIEEIQKNTIGILNKINQCNQQCKSVLENELSRIKNIEILDGNIQDIAQTISNITLAIQDQTTSILSISEKVEDLDKMVKDKFTTNSNIIEQDKAGGFNITKEYGRAIISFDGYLTKENVGLFINGYGELKNSIHTQSTILVLDTRNLSVFPKALEDDLGNFYCDYVNSFKKIYVLNGHNTSARSQLERMWRKCNILDKFIFINNINDIK